MGSLFAARRIQAGTLVSQLGGRLVTDSELEAALEAAVVT